jgi:hypothetical protein
MKRHIPLLFEYSGEPLIYQIVRFRRAGRNRVIRRNVTLAEAQRHCSDPAMCKARVWFDGYGFMPGCRPVEGGPHV